MRLPPPHGVQTLLRYTVSGSGDLGRVLRVLREQAEAEYQDAGLVPGPHGPVSSFACGNVQVVAEAGGVFVVNLDVQVEGQASRQSLTFVTERWLDLGDGPQRVALLPLLGPSDDGGEQAWLCRAIRELDLASEVTWTPLEPAPDGSASLGAQIDQAHAEAQIGRNQAGELRLTRLRLVPQEGRPLDFRFAEHGQATPVEWRAHIYAARPPHIGEADAWALAQGLRTSVEPQLRERLQQELDGPELSELLHYLAADEACGAAIRGSLSEQGRTLADCDGSSPEDHAILARALRAVRSPRLPPPAWLALPETLRDAHHKPTRAQQELLQPLAALFGPRASGQPWPVQGQAGAASAGPAPRAAAKGKQRADDPSDAAASGAKRPAPAAPEQPFKRVRLEEVPDAFFKSPRALDLRVAGHPAASIRLDPGLVVATKVPDGVPDDDATTMRPYELAYRECLEKLKENRPLQSTDDTGNCYAPPGMPGVYVIVKPDTVTLMLLVQGESFAVMHAAPPRELSLRLDEDDGPLSVAVPPARTPMAPQEAATLAKWLTVLPGLVPASKERTGDGSLALHYRQPSLGTLRAIVSECPLDDDRTVQALTELRMEDADGVTIVRLAPAQHTIGWWQDQMHSHFSGHAKKNNRLEISPLMGKGNAGGLIRQPVNNDLLNALCADELRGGLSHGELQRLVARLAERDEVPGRMQQELQGQGLTPATVARASREGLIALLRAAHPFTLEPLEWLLIPHRHNGTALVNAGDKHRRKLLTFMLQSAGPCGDGTALGMQYLGGVRHFPSSVPFRTQSVSDLWNKFSVAPDRERGLLRNCLLLLEATTLDASPLDRLRAMLDKIGANADDDENEIARQFMNGIAQLIGIKITGNQNKSAVSKLIAALNASPMMLQPRRATGATAETTYMSQHLKDAQPRIEAHGAPLTRSRRLLAFVTLLNAIAATESWPDDILDGVPDHQRDQASEGLRRLAAAAAAARQDEENRPDDAAAAPRPEKPVRMFTDTEPDAKEPLLDDPVMALIELPPGAIENVAKQTVSGDNWLGALRVAYQLDVSTGQAKLPRTWTPLLSDHRRLAEGGTSAAARLALFHAERQGLHVSKFLEDCSSWPEVRRLVGVSRGTTVGDRAELDMLRQPPVPPPNTPAYETHRQTLEGFEAFLALGHREPYVKQALQLVGDWMLDLEHGRAHFGGNLAVLAATTQVVRQAHPLNAFLQRAATWPSVALAAEKLEARQRISDTFQALYEYLRNPALAQPDPEEAAAGAAQAAKLLPDVDDVLANAFALSRVDFQQQLDALLVGMHDAN